MPLITSPKGANPVESRRTLSTRLIYTWVARVPGSVKAKAMRPRVLEATTGSSGMKAFIHSALRAGSPASPPLDDEIRDNAVEASVVVVARLDESQEALGPQRRPLTVDGDHELALTRLDGHFHRSDRGRRRGATHLRDGLDALTSCEDAELP